MGGIILIYAPHYLPSSKANLIRLKNSSLSCVYTTWKWHHVSILHGNDNKKKILKKIQLCCKKCRLCRKKKILSLCCVKPDFSVKERLCRKKKNRTFPSKKMRGHLRPEKQPCCDNPFWIFTALLLRLVRIVEI